MYTYVDICKYVSVWPRFVTARSVDVLVTRCIKIGLHWPAEDAVGHIISAGIAAGLEGRDRHEHYGRVSKFKQVLHKKCTGMTLHAPLSATQTVPLACRSSSRPPRSAVLLSKSRPRLLRTPLRVRWKTFSCSPSACFARGEYLV